MLISNLEKNKIYVNAIAKYKKNLIKAGCQEKNPLISV